MKRLIPAAIILVFTITACICANIYIEKACDKTLENIEEFCDEKITSDELEELWHQRKENMALFVNHSFLDQTTIYIGQLTVALYDSDTSKFNMIYKDIESVLSLVKDEQKFSVESFY